MSRKKTTVSFLLQEFDQDVFFFIFSITLGTNNEHDFKNFDCLIIYKLLRFH